MNESTLIDSHTRSEPIPGSQAENLRNVRTELRSGDIGAIVYLHGTIYAREYGFDHTFEAYVAAALAQFALSASPRERIWIVEQQGRIVGCIAIVAASSDTAQLRWFLVDPSARGLGLGRRLLHEAVAFSEECRYGSIILWTVSALTDAAHLYQSVGFEKVEQIPGRQWGADVVEEKYQIIFPKHSDSISRPLPA